MFLGFSAYTQNNDPEGGIVRLTALIYYFNLNSPPYVTFKNGNSCDV